MLSFFDSMFFAMFHRIARTQDETADAGDEDERDSDQRTLFVKNVNFTTSEATLQVLL